MYDNKEKSLSSTKSSNPDARLYVKPERAALFLERVANLPLAEAANVFALPDATREPKVRTVVGTFKDLLPQRPWSPFLKGLTSRLAGARPDWQVRHLRSALRDVWTKPSLMRKKLALMCVAGGYMANRESREPGESIPELDAFVSVLLYALEHAHLLRYCANPACKEPYFVAPRGSQIYCSSPCAEPAQREAKLRWWLEHGAKRRKKSRKKKVKHAKAT